MKHNRAKHFETPDALLHDAQTLAEDAQTLMEATKESVDEKVQAAREQLAETIKRARGMSSGLQKQMFQRAHEADHAIHEHPYQTAFVALGVGTILGLLFSRRT